MRQKTREHAETTASRVKAHLRKAAKNAKPTAAEIAAAVESERRRAGIDNRDWSDKTADRFCELTADIYNAPDAAALDEDTEVERRRGFAIVWNSCGVWRVEVKRGRVTRIV